MTTFSWDLDLLREETPGCEHRVHLNNAGAALMSSRTLGTITHHLELEARIGGYEAAAAAADRVEETYAALGRLVNAAPTEIALTDNSTRAWNAAFYSVRLGPGDRILTGRNEYRSSALGYLQVARRTGAEVVVVPDDEHGQVDVAALAQLMDERVKLVGLGWVPTSSGLVNPAQRVGEIVRGSDALYLLDATQAVGQLPVDVETLGCDFLTGTGRKFLRGPRGTGFLYARESVLDRVDPHVVEIAAAEWDGEDGLIWSPGARRFETWEKSYADVLGLGAAVQQALDLGLDAIADRDRELGRRLRDGLAGIDGVSVHDPGAERCAIVTCAVADRHTDDVAARLAEHGINVSMTTPGPYEPGRDAHPLVRLSPHYYNTEAEIDRTLEVVSDLVRS